MNRLLIAAALCSGMILGFGGVAHAGETTGNGKPTPIATYQAGSICAFSGLNDVPFAAGRVQSFRG